VCGKTGQRGNMQRTEELLNIAQKQEDFLLTGAKIDFSLFNKIMEKTNVGKVFRIIVQ
jgi:hypothetical protein